MWRSRSILGFSARLIVVYGLLLAPWPGINSSIASLYCSCGNAVFGSVAREGVVLFHPIKTPTATIDTHIHVRNLRTDGDYTVGVRGRNEAYLPLAVFVALALATPMPWRRRFGSLLLGLVAVVAVILGRHFVLVLFQCAHPSVGLLAPVYPWNMVLATGKILAADDIVMSMAASFLVWLVVCFRPREWELRIGGVEGKTGSTASTEGAAANAAPRGAKRKRRRGSRLQRAVHHA